MDMTPVYRQKMEYSSPPLAWNHRQTGEADIYFLSNQERRPRHVDVAFRVTGRVPELWDAETGDIRDAGVWRQENGRTVVPIRFAPAGSVFVVFRRTAAQADPVAQIHRPSRLANAAAAVDRKRTGLDFDEWNLGADPPVGQNRKHFNKDLPAPKVITGPWTVTFPPDRGAPDKRNWPRCNRSASTRTPA